MAFLQAGIHVICDKPLTTTLEDALDLAQAVRRTGLLFAVTHNYTGHPMVRQARQMVADGELGPIRVVQVEYAQDWLSTPLEKTGQKQAVWRTDPAQSGPGGSLGDIGTHAFNLASFVSGLNCSELAAELSTFVPGRRVDDNGWTMFECRPARGPQRQVRWAPAQRRGGNMRKRRGLNGSGRAEPPMVCRPGQTRSDLPRGSGSESGCARQPRAFGASEGYLEASQLYDMAGSQRALMDGLQIGFH